ncbi:MAG: membrane protein insertase YidC [Sphingomonadales bacterium]|nr:membrane protein insertase YidC [Sphingomonadales bacterium]
MDRNSLIGLFLIGLILMVYSYYAAPPVQDSEQNGKSATEAPVAGNDQGSSFKETKGRPTDDSIEAGLTNAGMTEIPDSSLAVDSTSALGLFRPFRRGTPKDFILQNPQIRVTLSSLGGSVAEVELKEYTTYRKTPLLLFKIGDARYNFTYSAGGQTLRTEELYFSPAEHTDSSLVLRVEPRNGSFIEHRYVLPATGYQLQHEVRRVNMSTLLESNNRYTELEWQVHTPSQERDLEDERKIPDIYYRYVNDEPDYLTINKEESEDLPNQVKWISFRQKFFSTSLIAEGHFDNAKISGRPLADSQHVAEYHASVTMPMENPDNERFAMRFYFGPNHFQELEALKLGLEKQVPLGWGIFGWVNRFIVIPVFNWLDSFSLSYGLIILILTLIIKVILFPLTYQSYVSGAKMKVLKPEIDELKSRFESDPARMQSEQMKLFQRAGVNPLGGCIPLLLQFPILIALFNFFPASIELRQQGFLWADDLSSYDSILDLPFRIPFYGAHVSLFTLLMTASTLLYTHFNNQISGVTGQMKTLGYIMPLMFLPVLNSYSSALSYYYFLANMITFGQQWAVRRFVIDEEAIHRKIQENKNKPVKKSRFQAKLEEMQRTAQQRQAPRTGNKGKGN